MDIFNRYFDQIKAEDELKEKTETYLLKTIPKMQSTEKYKKEVKNMNIINFPKRRIVVAACAVFAVLFSVSGYVYCKTPVNYVSLDINPSVEIGLNAFDKVVDVEAKNEDGESLIEEKDVLSLPVEDAINSLVQEASDQGFVKDDGSTVIAVTAESDNEDKAAELEEKSTDGINLAIANKKSFVAVYSNCSDLSLRNEAKEMGMSPGKYKLVKMLQVLDPSINVEDYKSSKVSEIMAKAAELVQNNTSAGNQDEETTDFVDKVKKIEQKSNQNKIKAAEKNKEQESEENENQGETQNQEQEQEQNQNGQNAASKTQSKGSANNQKNSNLTQTQTSSDNQKNITTNQNQNSNSNQQKNINNQNQGSSNNQENSNSNNDQKSSTLNQTNNSDSSQQNDKEDKSQNSGNGQQQNTSDENKNSNTGQQNSKSQGKAADSKK